MQGITVGRKTKENNRGIRKAGAMIHNKINFKTFLFPLFYLNHFLCLTIFQHSLPFLSLGQTLWVCKEERND
jgi:hypothetical protein